MNRAKSPEGDIPEVLLAEDSSTLLPHRHPVLSLADEVRTDLSCTLADSVDSACDAEMQRELSPLESAKFISKLRKRFVARSESYKRPAGVSFSGILPILEANPDRLWSLLQMEKSGGKVDIRAVEGNELVFCDFAQVAPKARCNRTYYQIIQDAAVMGVEIQDESGWRGLQKLGKFDNGTYIWVNSESIIHTGRAHYVTRIGDEMEVFRRAAGTHSNSRGWRAELRFQGA